VPARAHRRGDAETANHYDVHDGDMVCLLPRLAVSELLALAGLVRHLCTARSADVMLIANRAHLGPLRTLLGDVTDVRLKFVDDWGQLPDVLPEIEKAGYRVIPLPGFREVSACRILGISEADARFEFQVHRRLAVEHALHAKIVDAVGPVYAIVHDDDTRRIRRGLLPSSLPVVSVRDPRFRTDNLFDWIYAMENAAQCHFIDSCFMLLADSLALRTRKFLHAYACRTGPHYRYHDATVIY
jgi:hypothetical protein